MTMYKMVPLFIFIFAPIMVPKAKSQLPKDTISQEKKFSAGILPAIAFDSDLGFQYGILTNLYNYTPEHTYPNYANSLYFEASKYTAGSSMLRVFLDSKPLLFPLRTNLDCTFIRDLTNDFFGFNGAECNFNGQFEDDNSTLYLSRIFYKYDTQMFRVMGNIKGTIGQKKWYWVTGFSLLDYRIDAVDQDKINKQHPNDPLPSIKGLYSKYIDWGLISKEEKNGGFNTQLRAGLGYDSRDFESNPSSGIWSELLISSIPSFLSSHSQGNLQVTALHRQYFSLIDGKTTFAYRLMYHITPMGKTPFYLLSTIPASWLTSANSEGLGGAKTLRGIRRNRLIGNGIAMCNTEIRQKIISFKMKKQDIYLATNLFSDAGMVTQKYDIDLSNVPQNEQLLHFTDKKETLHISYGIGLKVAYNENFIVSADYGVSTRAQDGDSGLYINLNYLF